MILVVPCLLVMAALRIFKVPTQKIVSVYVLVATYSLNPSVLGIQNKG